MWAVWASRPFPPPTASSSTWSRSGTTTSTAVRARLTRRASVRAGSAAGRVEGTYVLSENRHHPASVRTPSGPPAERRGVPARAALHRRDRLPGAGRILGEGIAGNHVGPRAAAAADRAILAASASPAQPLGIAEGTEQRR